MSARFAEFPGLNDLPVWDGNPEMFAINADGAGLADTAIFGGQMIGRGKGSTNIQLWRLSSVTDNIDVGRYAELACYGSCA